MESIVAKEITKEPSKLTFEITIDKKFCFEEETKVFNEVKNNAKVDGYRKGHVPEEIIKTNFNDFIKEKTIKKLMDIANKEILNEKKMHILSSPVVDKIKEYTTDTDLSFEYSVEVIPEIELKNYKGIKLEKTIYEIKEEDIENTLKRLQNEKAILEDKLEDSIVIGDFVVIEYKNQDKKTGKIISKNDNFLVEVEPEEKNKFSAEMIGMKKNEPKTIELQNNIFNIKVKNIKIKKLPDINDEFAKSYGSDSVELLKTNIKKELENHYEEDSKKELREKAVAEIVEQNPIIAPESMVQNRLEEIKQRFINDLARENSSMEKIGLTEEKFSEKYMTVAEKQVKALLLLYKISELENINVTDEEMNKAKEQALNVRPDMKDKIEKYFDTNTDIIKYDIKEQKVIDFLINNAKIKEVKRSKK